MKKIISVLTLLIICIFSFSMHYVRGHGELKSPKELILKAFDASGANMVGSEIYFWSKTGNMDTVKKSDTLKNIEYDLSNALKGEYSSEPRKGVGIKITLKDDSNAESNIYGSIISTIPHREVEKSGNILDKIFKEYGIKANINTCISGEYEGRLSDEQMDSISSAVLREADAQRVEGMKDGNTLSISAYSPRIPGAIKSGNKKINLNVAMRYSPYMDKTCIWLATPVILKEY
ncbi:TATA-box binding protein [Anaerobacterium chartisolvens]|uniref:TATA-box binding protein n=1 Tax=Anaerobacterium chartisolvens TaxID=1297424 RepID=A0A369AQ43_9FIRM|nr:YwmB family TATA-box binding protein [Anaerobacterium chartisolvens]RCX11235.1 TATA-box binding protein [Anaerobacterium chartisolvens]